jgi:shikimate kinase
MGSGKTSVGKALAARLAVPFVDLDEVIIQRTQHSISAIFAAEGEPGFRTHERGALELALGEGPSVIATGGGAFCEPENRKLIRLSGALSVFLDVPWSVLCDRIAGDSVERPLFRDPELARQLFRRRRPIYLKADVTIDLAGHESPEQVATMIADELAEVACGT